MAKEFRQISLCNVLYEILAKALANRLKGLLDVIISQEQSAFVERWIRLMMMCVRSVIYAVLVNGHRYDSISPTRGLCQGDPLLPYLFVLAILVNGHKLDVIVLSRGLRQGDPLSPYLFLLVAAGLSSYTSKAVAERHIHGLSVARSAPVMSHLFFADDSIFFARATV
ncbi:unnamed protein product [Linum trigynum]|uniref:Reverse transcriptase domain-containing protein n=1 Tax=Linum trigynum TaxID=586398 RepID=A0AAV2FV73_9ROSI